MCYAFPQLHTFEHADPTARNGIFLFFACLTSQCFSLSAIVKTTINILLPADSFFHVSVVCAS